MLGIRLPSRWKIGHELLAILDKLTILLAMRFSDERFFDHHPIIGIVIGDENGNRPFCHVIRLPIARLASGLPDRQLDGEGRAFDPKRSGRSIPCRHAVRRSF